MATLFHPSALFLPSTTTSSPSPTPPKPLLKPHQPPPLSTTFAALSLAASLTLSPPPSLADVPATFQLYYGTAASASSYGGFGGNASKKDTAEYTYLVPEGWKERLVSKVEKGTNGTDSEFYNPKKKSEREYLTFLAGQRALTPNIDGVLGNLALSDVGLQDQIAGADAVRSGKREEGGQLYYTYEIDGAGAHSLISVTCARNKLYAHFVTAPTPEWNRDQDMLQRLHDSFKTVADLN